MIGQRSHVAGRLRLGARHFPPTFLLPTTTMKLQLQLVRGPEAGRVFPLIKDEPLIIGRGPMSHTKINDPHMSRIHCQLAWTDGSVTLTNEGNGNTWVRGNPVTSHKVTAGDEFQAGDCTFRLVDADALNASTVHAHH